jgi:hypothetical protein
MGRTSVLGMNNEHARWVVRNKNEECDNRKNEEKDVLFSEPQDALIDN